METGKLVEDNLSLVAHLYGYEDTGKFVAEKLLPFYVSNYDHVKDLEATNAKLTSTIQGLANLYSPDVKRELFRRAIIDLTQSMIIASQCTGHPITPSHLQGYVDVFWNEIYTRGNETEAISWGRESAEKIRALTMMHLASNT